MPTSITNVMQSADVSTDAADFQAPGTASAGTSTKLAAADHVHPGSGSWSLGYEVVSQTYTISTYPGGLVTLSAPTGKKVVGGGFKLGSGTNTSGNWAYALMGSDNTGVTTWTNMVQHGPASDGSAWLFNAAIDRNQNLSGSPNSTDIVLTVYAICIAA